jgi:hypothetical protein
MNVTVSQVLAMVGRLDDSPGFDTPRERFRRFLVQRITDPQAARLVIQQCQQISGEQTHRALQDAVVLTGRFLGFHTAFRPYQHDPGAAPVSGEWESRRRLRVLLSVCTDQTAALELEAFSQVVRNGLPAQVQANTARVGLCILSPLFAAKARIEEALRVRRYPDLRLASVPGILRMADLVAAGRLTHDDVLQMLHPDVSLDPLIERLDRWSTASRPGGQGGSDSTAAVEPRALPAPSGNCWVAAIRLDTSTPASQFVESVITRRRILPINPAAHVQRAVETGDAIAVYIAGTGFVAHAKVAGVITEGSPLVRNSERFTQVVTLSDVAVYHAPVVAAEELVRKIDESLSHGTTAVATPVSRQDFEVVTRAALFSEIR